MPATAITAAPMPTPIPAIAAWDRPVEVEPPAASPDEVAFAAESVVEDGEEDVVDEPVVSAAAVDWVLAEVVAVSVPVVEGDEVAGVVAAADVLEVVACAVGLDVCEAPVLGAAVPSGLASGWPVKRLIS